MKNDISIYGLVGFPLGHSFSARYFTEKFQTNNISAEYHNFEIPSIKLLPGIIEKTPALRGFNVTIPYKQQIIPLLDELDDNARKIGAVNVVSVVRGKTTRLIGHNSDVIGFCNSLRPLLRDAHKKALVLGTGGASCAVMHGLKQLGITPRLVSRTAKDGIVTYSDINADVMAEYKLVVNCTPLGMSPKTEFCPDIPYAGAPSLRPCIQPRRDPLPQTWLGTGSNRKKRTRNAISPGRSLMAVLERRQCRATNKLPRLTAKRSVLPACNLKNKCKLAYPNLKNTNHA